MIALLAWVTLLVVVRLGAVDGFFAPPSHFSARRPTPPTPPPHQRVASLSAAGLEWSKEGVPACYADAATLMTSALLEALAPQAGGRKLLSVDMLTPGLNPKLEQKALLSQEQLFDLVRSIIPALGASGRFRQVALMFPSMGDAAGYQKYAFQVKAPVPDWAVPTEVGVEYVPPDADCAVFITAKNNVGDPVISTIRDIVDAHPALTCVFLNCDLRDKVTTGIVARGARDAFRASIEPAFYFRNVVQVVRPTLVPIELGALTYTPRTQWTVYAVNSDDIVGPGSLNRYMKVPCYARDPQDPSAVNPPRFAVAGKYATLPDRDEIDNAIEKMAFKVAKAARDEEQQRKTDARGSKGGASWWPW